MKKIILTLMLGIMLFTVVSACGYNYHQDCNVKAETYIEGKITFGDSKDPAGKALVTVTCLHNDVEYTKTTWSMKNGPLKGTYFVIFPQSQCVDGDLVKVSASKDGLTGENEGEVEDWITQRCLDLDISIIDIPLVPEFGAFVAGLTVLGALGTFLIVRRKDN